MTQIESLAIKRRERGSFGLCLLELTVLTIGYEERKIPLKNFIQLISL
jgi:hypothetical protein